jgi:hypothetical protein
MRQTKKLLAAQRAAHAAKIPSNGDIYAELEKAGYRWIPASNKWEKFQAPADATKTGFIDIRIRAAIGEIELAAHSVAEALTTAGFQFSRVSAPDPDDRNGPATTCRVYFNGLLPTRPKTQSCGKTTARGSKLPTKERMQ